MKSAILLAAILLLLAPVIVGKLLSYRENRRWKGRLKGVSDRYMTDEERNKRSFHMKRFK